MRFIYSLTFKSVPSISTYLGQLRAVNATVSSVTVGEDSIQVESTVELYGEAIAALDSVVPASSPIIDHVKRSIREAMEFGSGMIVEFAAENVLLGITVESKTGEVLDKLSGVMLAVTSGSLYDAIAKIRAIPSESYDSKYITAARMLAFINKVEDYLGVPRSTSI
jgi:hypothetical protein